MQAPGPGAAALREGDAADLDLYDFEPLPTLPEDEENVSLADILSLRDGGLSEQEAWAVCLECSLALRSVAPAAIFQTLCITPDTLAFNTSGSVCFMEQLSDDPEGAFVPPEFDDTGNTFEAHIYSLGATLKAALEYPAGPEPGPELSRDLEALLSRMQAEDPGERPELQSVIALCEQKLQLASPCRLCRSLSAAGRRVLSLESFGAFQEVSESAWRGRPRRPPGDPGDLPTTEGPPQAPLPRGPEHPGTPPTKPLLSAPMRNGESHGLDELASLLDELDTPRARGALEPDFLERGHLRKVQTFPRLLPEGPEASGLCLPLTSAKNLLPASESPTADAGKGPRDGRRGLSSVKAPPKSRLWPEQGPEPQPDGAQAASQPSQGPAEESPPTHSQDPGEVGPAAWTPKTEGTLDAAGQPGSTAAEQDVRLRDLLRQLGRPFREYELWALALACLRALRAQRQRPAYLSPDSVLVAEDGAVRLAPPPAHGAPDAFFLAPEAAEQKPVTEKASVYCVAAVLWAAAKFGVPRGRKLALPHRLKTLLLDMAHRRAPERPSVAEATKMCSAYLLQRGMDSRKILAHLRASTCQADQEEETIGLRKACPVAGLSPRTVAATQLGPGGRPPCGPTALELPPAFTSAATHFTPIELPPRAGVARDTLALPSGPRSEQPGPAPEPLEGSALREPAQGHAPPSAPASPPSGASSRLLASPAPSQALKAQVPPQGQGPEEQVLPGASAGGHRPLAPGPAAAPGSRHPAKPPRAPAIEPRGQEPGSTWSASRGPALAAAGPESPGGTATSEQGDQTPDGHPERPRPADPKSCPSGVDAPPLPGRAACPSLQEAMRLIQEEFAFDGYLDNGLEALIMGEHILGLRDLTFATFCGAVSEKFSDLYWGEKLLCDLFAAVNRRGSSPEGSSSSPGSLPSSPGATATPVVDCCWRGALLQARASEEAAPQREGGGWTGQPGGCSPASRRASLRGAGKEKLPAAGGSRAPCPGPARSDSDTEELSGGNLEVGFRPQTSLRARREPQAEAAEAPRQAGPGSEAGARPARREEGRGAGVPSGSPGWGSAFYEEACFGADVHRCAQQLAGQQALDADTRNPALEQQLVMEKRSYRKTLKFYQKLLQKEKRHKGSEVKTMLARLRGQLEETQGRVQQLGLVRRYLQVLYAERWGLEPCALPDIVNVAAAQCGAPAFSPLDESSSLIFYNVSKPARGGRPRRGRVLQAGTPLGLMAYLYSSDAFREGYVQQFLYTFRYFCTPQDFLRFLLDRISGALSRAPQDPTSTKIYKRSFCLLQAWVEDCLSVDFARNAGLLGRLEDFISTKILPLDGAAEQLLGLLEVGADRRAEGAPCSADLEDPRVEEEARPLSALCKRLSEDGISRKSFPWRLSRGTGLALPQAKERQYSIAAALPRPCFLEDVHGPLSKASEKGPYFLTEHSAYQLFTQLTLLQQELFQKCHPVHFLNSRALGVMDRSAALPCSGSAEGLATRSCSLFLPSYVQDRYLLQLLRSADDVSTWVAAEIVSSPNAKVTLLSKFLLTAKACCEHRNFATAMQILGGLEHLAVRQSPAWKILPAKMAEALEELKAVEVFLKSDSLCLMEGRRSRAQPTLPSARLLAMHVQQLETGGFTMTNGAHRWSKLRNIARVVSQVPAFQESPYTFPPDPKLQAHLRRRIARFSGADVALLAAVSRPEGPQGGSGKPSRKLQDKLRRMRATFQ